MAQKYDDILSRLSSSLTWSDKNEEGILEPYTYVTSKPGKEFRGRMVEAFNHWLHVPPEKLEIITKVVRMLHTASLLVDDIQDDSQMRRGLPVAHKIYGVPQTINSANYVYFLALKEVESLRSLNGQSLDQLIIDEMCNLHRGQGLEILWRDSLRCPTEEEYVEMVNNKTGGLFRIAIKLMMSQSELNVDYVPLGNLIGVLFQIRDDYVNLQLDEHATGKSFAEDLTEGKFSFPVVHSVRADRSNRQVINVLQKRPSTPTTKKYIIDYMAEHTKSFEYTLSVLKTLDRQAREEIERLGGNEMLERIMDTLLVRD